MVRMCLVAVSVMAIVTLVAEGLAVGVLWSQGRLTAETVREIRAILRDPSDLTAEEEALSETPRVSLDDVIAARSRRIIDLEGWEQEQGVLQALVDDARDGVLKDQLALQTEKDTFLSEQEARLAKLQSETVQRTRNLLLKLEPDQAAEQLMQLPLAQDVAILQNMPEKNIAELLQAFSGGSREQVARGQEIFQAITRGNIPDDEPGDTL